MKKLLLFLSIVCIGQVDAQSTISVNDGFFYFVTHDPAYNEVGANYSYRCKKPRGLSMMLDYGCAFLPQTNSYNKVSGLIGYSSDLQRKVQVRLFLGGGLINTSNEYYPLLNHTNPKYLKSALAGINFKINANLRAGVDFGFQTYYVKNKDLRYNGHGYVAEYHWYHLDMATIKFALIYIFKQKQS